MILTSQTADWPSNMYASTLRPPIITRPHKDVVHMRFPDQKSLCHNFIRLTEFYEAPYPEIRGNYFKLDDYKRLYTVDHGRPFSYYKDWHGFNVPGRVVRAFAKTFAHDLTFEERRIVDLKPMAYLIGTWRDAELSHEMAHAMYHLSRRYRETVRALVSKMWATDLWLKRTGDYGAFEKWLYKEGYTSGVITDEFGAYFSTNDLEDFSVDFSWRRAKALYRAAKPFRDLYAKIIRSPSWNA